MTTEISQSFINIGLLDPTKGCVSDHLNIFDDYTDILADKPKKDECKSNDILKEIISSQTSLTEQCNVIIKSQLLIIDRLSLLTQIFYQLLTPYSMNLKKLIYILFTSLIDYDLILQNLMD